MIFSPYNSLAQDIHLNRLLNTAYKKEEIRRPAKANHHQIKLYEPIHTNLLGLSAEELHVYASVHTHGLLRRVGEKDDDSEIGVYVNIRRALQVERGWGTAMSHALSHRIRSSDLEKYVNHAVRLFFDLIYSVEDPRTIRSSEEWSQHLQHVEQKNKWPK